MSKKVFKEIVIALLLCLVIILVTSLLLYNYVPTRKILPDEVAYRTPEWINKELMSSETDDDRVVTTYEVNGTDMNNYESINSYNPGRANPFENIEGNNNDKVTTSETTTDATSDTSNTSSTSNASNVVVTEGEETASKNTHNSQDKNTGGEPGFYNYKNGK